jgi:hypothetical protein
MYPEMRGNIDNTLAKKEIVYNDQTAERNI